MILPCRGYATTFEISFYRCASRFCRSVQSLTWLIPLVPDLQKKYATFEKSFDRRLAGEPDSYEMSSSDDGGPGNGQDQEDEDAEDKR